jgi:Lar family restriction alleviation protein
MQEEELRACPFCGDRDLLMTEEFERNECHVRCHFCGATGPDCLLEEDAVEKWNKRPF